MYSPPLSVDYPNYVLMKDSAGRLGIYMTAKGEEPLLVRDDGMDLRADFETHVDELAEELRVLMAEARAEFGF